MKKYAVILYIILWIVPLAGAQNLEKADMYYRTQYYAEAITLYQELLEANVGSSAYLEKQLALAHYKQFNYQEAYRFFQKIKTQDTLLSAEDYTAFAHLHRNLEKYDDAEVLLDEANLENLAALKQLYINWPRQQGSRENNNYRLHPTNIETQGKSFGLVTTEDGVLFSQPVHYKEDATFYYELQKLRKISDTVFSVSGEPALKGAEPTFYRGTPTLNASGSELFFTANASRAIRYNPKKAGKKKLSDQGVNVLKIYSAELVGEQWEQPRELSFNSNQYSCAFPHVWNDDVLFFSSNKEGGKGKMDIYYSIREAGVWTDPRPLHVVNTFEDEAYPFVVGDKFYFSSKGREGYGGMDVYEANITLEGERVMIDQIHNMGKPVNSSKDDFSFVMNDQGKGYLSTNRANDNGKDEVWFVEYYPLDTLSGVVRDELNDAPLKDVIVQLFMNDNGRWVLQEEQTTLEDGMWMFVVDPRNTYKVNFIHPAMFDLTVEVPNEEKLEERNEVKQRLKNVILIRKKIRIGGVIVDAITEEPIDGATIDLYRREGNNWVDDQNAVTNPSGNWDLEIERNDDYKLTVNAVGYERKELELTAIGDQPVRDTIFVDLRKLKLDPIVAKADTIRINNIYFAFNSAKLREESFPILNNLIDYLNKNKHIKIEIGAHTDAVGSSGFNMGLSRKRATTCFNYLVKKGISRHRLYPKGYGEKYILNGCLREGQCTEEENEVNRRIELKIL